VATQIWGIAAGFMALRSLVPTFMLQIVLGALFVFSYLNARELK
jgi:hypothetical protein